MATGEARGVSSMPLPPMQYVNLYTDENVKKGRAPKPPPPVKVISYNIFGSFYYYYACQYDVNNMWNCVVLTLYREENCCFGE